MARNKIDYGIDLGTTNSAICKMENGEVIIKKSDTQKDIMPSCISINKKCKMRVGDSAYNDLGSDKKRATKNWKVGESNAYVEFKRTMGTDKIYHSSYMDKDFSSEELSAEVLKTLKSFITDENIHSVVITVPAKFDVNQKTATLEAAKLAGFKKCELLQEPIAAAMAYGLSSNQDNGIWMVFDFGGGTFDAALIKVQDGIIQVFDTEGDNYLGGKDLDYAIVDKIIIPYIQDNFDIDEIMDDSDKKCILRDAMKTYAEPVKNQLSFKESEDIMTDVGELGTDDFDEEIEIDMTISREDAYNAMRPFFQKAINICLQILKRNNLSGSDIDKIILVGGPTYSPLVREMLKKQICANVDTSIDPMTAVAKGAALYASTLDAEIDENDIVEGTVRFNIDYQSTSVEEIEYIPICLDNSIEGSYQGEKVIVELVSADKTWSSGKVEIDATGNVIEAQLRPGKANQFSILTYDIFGNSLTCFPDSITIIQGTKVGSAPLPYNISVGVFDLEKKKEYCQIIDGLEKNKPLPASGIISNLKTTSYLEAGNINTKVLIPVYQSESLDNKIQSKHSKHVCDVEIFGSDVNNNIPDGTAVSVKVNVDSNEQMEMEVSFIGYDALIKKSFNTGKKQETDTDVEVEENFEEAEKLIAQLKNEGIDTSELDVMLDDVKEESENSNEGKAILEHQKAVIREIEQRQSESEFDRLTAKLEKAFAELERDQDKYGDYQTGQQVNQLRMLKEEAISKKNLQLVKDVLEMVDRLDFRIALIEYYIAWIYNWNKNFYSRPWTDYSRARSLVDKAMNLVINNPTVDDLKPYIDQLLELLPDSSQQDGAMGRLTRG